MLLVWPCLLLFIASTFAFQLSQKQDHFLARRLPSPASSANDQQALEKRHPDDADSLSKRAPGVTLWTVALKGDESSKTPVFTSKDAGASSATLSADVEDTWTNIQNKRAALRVQYSKKPLQRPSLQPVGQNLACSLWIPGGGDAGGTWSVSTAEEGGPVSDIIITNIATATPELAQALTTNGVLNLVVPLHVEVVCLYRFLIRNPTFLAANGGRFPQGTAMRVYGKYNPDDTDVRIKSSCMDNCMPLKIALNIL